MSRKILNLNTIDTLPVGNYLLDANVLLYLFDVIQGKNDPGYSDIIYNSTRENVEFFVNPFIISEYVNRLLRNAGFAYSEEKQITNYNFKRDFRPTDEFCEIYAYCMDSVKQEVLDLCSLSNPLDNHYIGTILDEKGVFDFNDLLIVCDAIQNNFSIITNDKDYFNLAVQMDNSPCIMSLQKFIGN